MSRTYTTRPGDTQQGVARMFGVTLLALIAAQMGHPGKDARGRALPVVPRSTGARFCESCWNHGVTITLPAHAKHVHRVGVGAVTGGAQDWAGSGGGVPDATRVCHKDDGVGATAIEPCCAGYAEDPITGKCSACTALGLVQTSDAPCCDGLVLAPDGTCRVPEVTCIRNGLPSASAQLCCSGYTDANGYCAELGADKPAAQSSNTALVVAGVVGASALGLWLALRK